jgi:hypothetical protein
VTEYIGFFVEVNPFMMKRSHSPEQGRLLRLRDIPASSTFSLLFLPLRLPPHHIT